MNKLKENKKLFAIILIISLIAILLGSYAIYKNSSKTETAAKIEKSEKLEKKAEKKLKEAKKSGDKEEIAKAEKELKEAEEKTEEIKKDKTGNSSKATNSSTSKPSSTASKPSTNSSSGGTSTKPKEKKKVWIVDKPAWTETVQEPIYSTRTKFLLKDDNNNLIGIFYSESEVHAKQKELSRQNILTSYSFYDEEYISGYNTKTINHPEEGHEGYR